MANIRLDISLDDLNYVEIISKEKGSFVAFLARLPLIGRVIRSKVDSIIRDELCREIRPALAREIAAGLRAKGISARVTVAVS